MSFDGPNLRLAFPFLPRDERDVVEILPSTVSSARILALVRAAPPCLRDDLVGTDNRLGGSGGTHGVFLELGSWFLKTSRERRYPDPRTAFEVERNAELRRQKLGIYHPGRTWFLTRGEDAAFWACSLTPTLSLLRSRLNRAAESASDREAWQIYLDAFRLTFEVATREGLLLDCNPNNFGLAGDRLYYVDDDLAPGTGRMPFGHQLLLRLREYESVDLTIRLDFVRGFAALVEEYRSSERLCAHLREDLESEITWPVEPTLREELEGLVRRLGPPARSVG